MNRALFPIFAGVVAIGMTVAHWMVFIYAPVKSPVLIDAAGGQAHRIMYFHVPSAWICYLGFVVCFVCSLAYLWNRKTKWDACALASAEVGLVFGACVLLTGPLWAKAAWGVWWKWEPRLTSMFLLYMVFAAYWVLRSYGGQTQGVRMFGAVLAVFGAPNIIFVHTAVAKMGGDHPDDVARSGLGPEQRLVLYGSLLVFIILFVLLVRLRYRMHTDELTVRAIRRRLAKIGGAR